MHRKTILIDQQEISYLDSGDAPKTLVFIHGMGCNALSWKHQIQDLSNECRCIAVDLPAHGFSQSTHFKPSIYNFSELLYHFFKALNLNDIRIVAHSMGAQISLMYALKYASTLNKLYLIAPAGFERFNAYEKNLIKKSLELLNLKPMVRNIKLLSAWLPPKEPSVQEVLMDIENGSNNQNIQDYLATIAQCTNAMLDEPVQEYLKNIQIDMRIVYGLKDKMIPNPISMHKNTLDHIKNVQSLVPSAQLLEINDAGHFPQIERFNRINADIKSYFGM